MNIAKKKALIHFKRNINIMKILIAVLVFVTNNLLAAPPTEYIVSVLLKNLERKNNLSTQEAYTLGNKFGVHTSKKITLFTKNEIEPIAIRMLSDFKEKLNTINKEKETFQSDLAKIELELFSDKIVIFHDDSWDRMEQHLEKEIFILNHINDSELANLIVKVIDKNISQQTDFLANGSKRLLQAK